MGGLYMLAEQARCAAEIFTGRRVDMSRTGAAVRMLRRRKENLILIGMPGCGKSTVGRRCAELLGREFVDSDTELEKDLGMPIPEFMSRYGEQEFRDRECRVIARLGRESGLVLATGGGVVTRPENYPALHQNGTMIFLEREISKLPKRGRPLSQKGNMVDMYAIRLPMYRRFADITTENNGNPDTVAREVVKCYEDFGH